MPIIRPLFGEIDLIMMDAGTNTLVFIEVRYRKNTDYGAGFESISRSKQKKIITSAKCFIRYKPQLCNRPYVLMWPPFQEPYTI